MSRDVADKTIDGIKFTVHQLPAREAEDTLLDLLKLAAPALATGIGELDLSKGLRGLVDNQLGVKALIGAVRELSDRFDKSLYHEICDRLAAVSFVTLKGDGKERRPQLDGVQDEVFRGRIATKWRWLAFALEVQYEGFFAEFASIGARLEAMGAGASKSRSPGMSAGPSGES